MNPQKNDNLLDEFKELVQEICTHIYEQTLLNDMKSVQKEATENMKNTFSAVDSKLLRVEQQVDEQVRVLTEVIDENSEDFKTQLSALLEDSKYTISENSERFKNELSTLSKISTDKFDKNIKNLQQQLSILTVNTKDSLNENISSSIKNFKKELSTLMEKSITTFGKNIESGKTQISSSINSAISDSEKSVQDTVEVCKALKERANILEENLKQMDLYVNEYSNAMNKLKDLNIALDVENIQSSISDYKDIITNFVENSSKQQDNAVESINQMFKSYDGKLNNIQSSISDYKDVITNFVENSSKQQDNAVEFINQMFNSYDGKLNNIQKVIMNLNSGLANMDKNNNDKSNQILKSIEGMITGVASINVSFEAIIKKQSEALTNIYSRLSVIENKSNGEKQIQMLTAVNNQLTTINDKQMNMLIAANDKLRGVNDRFDNIEGKLNVLNGNMTTTFNTINQMQNKFLVQEDNLSKIKFLFIAIIVLLVIILFRG